VIFLIVKTIRCLFVVKISLKSTNLTVLFSHFILISFNCLCHWLNLIIKSFKSLCKAIDFILNFLFSVWKEWSMRIFSSIFQFETTSFRFLKNTNKFIFKCGFSCKTSLSLSGNNWFGTKWNQDWIFSFTSFPFLVRIWKFTRMAWWINFCWESSTFSWNFERILLSLTWSCKSPGSIQFIFRDINIFLW